jgi:argininosuccinate lyase
VLSGRIVAVPAQVWDEEVLGPQFAYEAEHLLPWYVAIEKVLLLEYARLGVLSADEVRATAARLASVTDGTVGADRHRNMSDIAFALEQHVTEAADGSVAAPAWHVDRSRNDMQATAQICAARGWTISAALDIVHLGLSVEALAAKTTRMPMPGYTHMQAAQVISPGFYLAALGEETLNALRRLRSAHEQLDASPLGAGAMSGQELAWDRERMARLLGFGRVQPHALVSVASRTWALSLAADVCGYGTALSRFATDLMAWGAGAYGFIDLPDALAGISSAMPQKKNFPILERIRGRSAHLAGYHADLALGLRATPYTNMVEVSKEAGANLLPMFRTLHSVLRLFTTVVDHLEFQPVRMRAACEREYLGGFTLANLLTLRCGVPWRQAQVLAGQYIVAAMERGLPPSTPDGELLARLGEAYAITEPDRLLAEAFDVDRALHAKTTAGGTHPDAVSELLAAQRAEYAGHAAWWEGRRDAVAQALSGLDAELTTTLDTAA